MNREWQVTVKRRKKRSEFEEKMEEDKGESEKKQGDRE